MAFPFTSIFFQDTKSEIFSNLEPLYLFMSGTIHVTPTNQKNILFIPQVVSELIQNSDFVACFLSQFSVSLVLICVFHESDSKMRLEEQEIY